MTIENVCRINVWPTMAAARAAFDGADGSELCGRMIVWPTTALAKEYYTENAGEGGGGAPGWVPSGAKIHIDFLGGTPQGRAWVDGTGAVAVATLLGNDANADSGWGETTGYDNADLTANGYEPGTTTAFLGAARTKLLAGATVLAVQKQLISGSGTLLNMVSADGGAAIQVDVTKNVSDNVIVFSSWSGSIDSTLVGQLSAVAGAINKIAYTVTSTRLEATTNGYATPIADVLLEEDRPAANPLVAALFHYKSGFAAMQYITIYDPLPTTNGLAALSAIT